MKLRICLEPRCGELTIASRCQEHAIDHAQRLRADREQREPWRYLYGLKIWREAREAARRHAGYRCERCGRGEEHGRRTLDVHHVTPLADLWTIWGGGTPAFDQAAFERDATDTHELLVLCDPCHGREEIERC